MPWQLVCSIWTFLEEPLLTTTLLSYALVVNTCSVMFCDITTSDSVSFHVLLKDTELLKSFNLLKAIKSCRKCRIPHDSCHDLRSVSCLVSSFPVLFWKITNFPLSFQVTCPSSCVKCLIVFPDSHSVSTCSPWSLVCSNSLRLPCPVPLCCVSVFEPSLPAFLDSQP